MDTVLPVAVGFASYAMLAHGMPTLAGILLVSYLGRENNDHRKVE